MLVIAQNYNLFLFGRKTTLRLVLQALYSIQFQYGLNHQAVTPCVCHPFVTQNLWEDKKQQITAKKNMYRPIG